MTSNKGFAYPKMKRARLRHFDITRLATFPIPLSGIIERVQKSFFATNVNTIEPECPNIQAQVFFGPACFLSLFILVVDLRATYKSLVYIYTWT